jgi:hypothetical protein
MLRRSAAKSTLGGVMSERLDKLRRGVEAVAASRYEEERGSLYAYAEDAAYQIPARGITIRGRADIEGLLTNMGGNMTFTIVNMMEHGRAVVAMGAVDNRIPNMEYQGPLTVVWLFNDADEISEHWNFRS